MEPMIYLDYNATAPCAPEVVETMLPCFGTVFGNPASLHPYGRSAALAVRRATTAVAELIGALPEQILFTSCATEANNHVVRNAPPEGGIIISNAEHASLYAPARQHGQVCCVAPRVEEILAAVEPRTVLVALNLANHETGELLPEAETLSPALRERGIALHFDATQAVGRIPVDVRRLGCDTLAFSAHKIYGPKGIGVLFVRDPGKFRPLLLGGGQQEGLRAGTLNVPGIVGMGKAAELAIEKGFPSPALRDRFEAQVAASGAAHKVAAADRPRLPQTSCLLLPGWDGAKLVDLLGGAGVAASSGSACSGGEPSRILAAQGVDQLYAAGALRFSFGRDTTAEEADAAARILLELIANHQHPGVIDVGNY